jgi:hypothetical protein
MGWAGRDNGSRQTFSVQTSWRTAPRKTKKIWENVMNIMEVILLFQFHIVCELFIICSIDIFPI